MLDNIQKWIDIVTAVIPQVAVVLSTINLASTATPNSHPNKFLNIALKIVNFLSFNFGRSKNA